MFARIVFFFLSTLFFIPVVGYSQSQAALPSLTLTPGAEAHGMGEASVAVLSDDPVAAMVNPAQLGMQSLGGLFGFGYNHSNWLPGFQNPEIYYRTYAFTTGLNFQKTFGISPELAFGFSYSRMHFNLSDKDYESSNNFTIGVGFNFWVRIAAGISFKHATSFTTFALPDRDIPVTFETNFHDVGLFTHIPVLGVINRLRANPVSFFDNLFPSLDFSFGVARNNLSSNGGIREFPRYARAGIAITFGMDIKQDQNSWRAFTSRLSVEANDLLLGKLDTTYGANGNVTDIIRRDYQTGLGDIDFFDEVVSGHTNSETIKKKGWEISFFEIVSIRGGRYEEDENRGNRRYSTSGFSLALGGMLKLLQASHVIGESDGAVGFLIKHLDIRYHHSSIDTDEPGHPLDNTTYNSVNLLIRN